MVNECKQIIQELIASKSFFEQKLSNTTDAEEEQYCKNYISQIESCIVIETNILLESSSYNFVPPVLNKP